VTAEQVGEPGEDDPARHALGERLAEREASPEPAGRASARLFGQGRGGAVAGRGGDAVEQDPRVLGEPRPDVGQEGLVQRVDAFERARGELDALALPAHPPERVEGQVGPGRDDDGHHPSLPDGLLLVLPEEALADRDRGVPAPPPWGVRHMLARVA
jgi:hypothetical protein